MKYQRPEKLSDSKLKAYHWWLHSRYSREDVSRKEVIGKHVETVRVMEARGLKHPRRDKLDRETNDVFAREGGPGSGNFGHAGRPGMVGGSTSGPGRGGVAQIPTTPLETRTKALLSAQEAIKEQALLYGVSEAEIVNTCEEWLQDHMDGSELSIRVPVDVVSTILDDGKLKTQYETHKTKGGVFDPEWRQRAERNAFGEHKEHPIYGYLHDRGGIAKAEHYGGARIVLNPTVQQRTTISVGDSLYHFDTQSAAPSPLGNLDRSSWDKEVFTIYRQAKGRRTGFDYIEAQIHGGVKTNDISKIVFDRVPSKSVIAKLSDKGISWEQSK